MRWMLTGLTRESLKDRDTGKLGRSCYLCRRMDGEESAVLKGEEGVAPQPVFEPLRVEPLTWMMASETEGEVEMVFPLCTECQVILGLYDSGDEEEEDGDLDEWI